MEVVPITINIQENDVLEILRLSRTCSTSADMSQQSSQSLPFNNIKVKLVFAVVVLQLNIGEYSAALQLGQLFFLNQPHGEGMHFIYQHIIYLN